MKVSIIIPVYNQENLILKALESIPNRRDIEVIVVDDHSTDGTVKAIKNWYKYSNVEWNMKLLLNEKRLGSGRTRNVALPFVEGEYIFCLDSDDYIITDKFNEVIGMLNEDIVYIDLEVNDGQIMELHPETKIGYCSFIDKFVKTSFWGKSTFSDAKAGSDWTLNLELQNKPHTENFTHIVAYHYNYPREGSNYNLLITGRLDEIQYED